MRFAFSKVECSLSYHSECAGAWLIDTTHILASVLRKKRFIVLPTESEVDGFRRATLPRTLSKVILLDPLFELGVSSNKVRLLLH